MGNPRFLVKTHNYWQKLSYVLGGFVTGDFYGQMHQQRWYKSRATLPPRATNLYLLWAQAQPVKEPPGRGKGWSRGAHRLPTSTSTQSQELAEALKLTDLSHGICLAAQLRRRLL